MPWPQVLEACTVLCSLYALPLCSLALLGHTGLQFWGVLCKCFCHQKWKQKCCIPTNLHNEKIRIGWVIVWAAPMFAQRSIKLPHTSLRRSTALYSIMSSRVVLTFGKRFRAYMYCMWPIRKCGINIVWLKHGSSLMYCKHAQRLFYIILSVCDSSWWEDTSAIT